MAGSANNTGDLPESKDYLNLDGLSHYDSKIKQKIDSKETAGAASNALAQAKAYTDAELQEFSTETNAALSVLAKEIDTKAESDHTHNYAGSETSGGAATQAVSDVSGRAFQQYYDTLIPLGGQQIPDKSNLATPEFLKIGKYYTQAYISYNNITGIPDDLYRPFSMTVRDVTQRGSFAVDIDETTNTNSTGTVYRQRTITDTYGDVWTQRCMNTLEAGVWIYDDWIKVINDNDNVKLKLTGGITATGSGNFKNGIAVEVPSSSIVVQDENISWGGPNKSGTFGPFDAALIPELGANRLALMPPGCITIEYSTDAGETWEDYGCSDNSKTNLVSGIDCLFTIGKNQTVGTDTTNYQLRVTLDSYDPTNNDRKIIYTKLKKFAINVSSSGSTGCKVKLQGLTGTDYDAGNDTWNTLIEANVSGWSGWNIINNNIVFGSTNNYKQYYRKLRFVFSCTGHSDTQYKGLSVLSIMAFGGVGWSTPSELARTGHMYKWDANGRTTFPGELCSEVGILDKAGHNLDQFYDSFSAAGATAIPKGADLNTTAYLKHGRYYTTAADITRNLSNCPVTDGMRFYMIVRADWHTTVDNEDTVAVAGTCRLREITTAAGDKYFQKCETNSSGQWLYGEWIKYIDAQDLATTSANGLLSKTDKAKLDGISAGATKVVVDTDLNASSTNAVQNKAVTTELNNVKSSVTTAQSTLQTNINKVQTDLDAVEDKTDDHIANANIHFTAAERTKLSGVATGANNYSHPNSGVTAGTYKSVKVDAQGHVTAGSNPTTLAGYGITDAEAKGTVNTHNVSTSAHSDIRTLIASLTTKVNNFLDVDDETTDQLSEIIALINANKTDIASITSDKVNVSDIVNNLTTNVTNKPLSAAQGVAIKTLIDNLSANKVDKVSGKGLSTNDFTDASLNKLNSIVDGTTTVKGLVKLENGVTSTSTTTAATPSSVKTAYDLANTAKTNAATAQTKADSAYDLADTKANAVHSHAIGDVTNLQSALDSKAATGHTHTTANITDLQTVLDGKADAEHSHDNYVDVSQKGTANGVATLDSDGKVPASQLPESASNAGGLSYRIENAVFAAANWVWDYPTTRYKYVYDNANISETTVVNVMFTLTSLSYANEAGVQQEVIEGAGNITIYSNAIPSADLVADILIYGAVSSEELTADAQTEFSTQVSGFATRLTALENKNASTRNYWSLYEVGNTLTASNTMEEIFNAMDNQSNLYCTISDASTSIYPAASGVLEIHKINASYGMATFHYDGKVANGTFTA